MFKKNKIYKFVYKQKSDYYERSRTLLVVAKEPMQALKKFYKIADNDVEDILEFTVVTPKEEEVGTS